MELDTQTWYKTLKLPRKSAQVEQSWSVIGCLGTVVIIVIIAGKSWDQWLIVEATGNSSQSWETIVMSELASIGNIISFKQATQMNLPIKSRAGLSAGHSLHMLRNLCSFCVTIKSLSFSKVDRANNKPGHADLDYCGKWHIFPQHWTTYAFLLK